MKSHQGWALVHLWKVPFSSLDLLHTKDGLFQNLIPLVLSHMIHWFGNFVTIIFIIYIILNLYNHECWYRWNRSWWSLFNFTIVLGQIQSTCSAYKRLLVKTVTPLCKDHPKIMTTFLLRLLLHRLDS